MRMRTMNKDGVTTFRSHLEMHFCNFAVLKVTGMKPSALKRKRCAELFATFLAQNEPRNAEHSLCPAYGRPSRQARHPRRAFIIVANALQFCTFTVQTIDHKPPEIWKSGTRELSSGGPRIWKSEVPGCRGPPPARGPRGMCENVFANTARHKLHRRHVHGNKTMVKFW